VTPRGVRGASEGISDQRLLEQRAADLTEHLRLALEAGGLGTFRSDTINGLVEFDARMEALFGLAPGDFEGTREAWVAMEHPDDRHLVAHAIEQAVTAREPFTVEHRVVWPDGSVHWLHSFGRVKLDEAGNLLGAIGCARDVTQEVVAEMERRRLTTEAIAAAEQERIHRERLEFLAGINDAVASACDRHEVMVNVAWAAVPRLGDWCSIYVLPHPEARIPDIETAHVDPAMVEYARQLQERFPFDPDAPTGMPRVIREGTTEFYQAIDDDLINDLDASQDARDIVRDLELWSSIAVPLVKRGRVLGGLQLIMTKSRRHYSNDDRTLVEAVASRVASSLENLRLSEEQRSIASTLQASLLPQQLPEITGVDVAVRYWASGDGVDVGGDFYDLFRIADERWGVVIGDVCGKGPRAAALTGMARHTIATAAWHGDDHVAVLTNLNRSMLERDAEAFCTAVYGTLQRSSTGLAFTFACGGHPLPILVRSAGPTTSCGVPGSLIGVLERIHVAVTTVELHPGDTVVLYTDGATDVAPPNAITTGQFTDMVERASRATTSAEQLVDRLHTELSTALPIDDRGDDIALLVLRLPQLPRQA